MMKVKQILVALVLFIFISLLKFGFVTDDVYATKVMSVSHYDKDSECMQSFNAFAYFGPNYWSQRQSVIYSNWQLETAIHSGPNNIPVEYPIFALEATRIIDGQEEIWMSGASEEGLVWLVYRPELKEWERIIRTIDNTILISDHLFISSEGTIFSSLRWSLTQSDMPELETVPILAKFDEKTRQFTIQEDVMNIPFRQEMFYGAWSVSPWPLIVLDELNTFWVFVNYDGLYSFNPDTNVLEKHVDIIEYPIVDVALAPDGSLFFSKPANQVGSTRAVYGLSQGMLFQFIPQSNEIKALAVPNQGLPGFNGMLVDPNGILYLGATSYRMPNGIWNLIHPDIESYFNHAGDHTWATPKLIFESSDGRLWFNRYLDGSGGGTAWYDIETGDGCLFNGEASNIIEDANQTLWMIMGGNLYKYPLND